MAAPARALGSAWAEMGSAATAVSTRPQFQQHVIVARERRRRGRGGVGREGWVLLKIPRGDINELGDVCGGDDDDVHRFNGRRVPWHGQAGAASHGTHRASVALCMQSSPGADITN